MKRAKINTTTIRNSRNNTTNTTMSSMMNPSLTGPQKELAEHIILGHLNMVRSRIPLPDSYYNTVFDRQNHKLIAFAIFHAMKHPLDQDRKAIVRVLTNNIPTTLPKSKHGLKTAMKGVTNHSIAHVAATHALNTNSYNAIRHRNVANHTQGLLFPNLNTYARKANAKGKRAHNYAQFNTTRQHIQRLSMPRRNASPSRNTSRNNRRINDVVMMLQQLSPNDRRRIRNAI